MTPLDQIRQQQQEHGRKDLAGASGNSSKTPAKLTGHEAYIDNLRASKAEVKLYLLHNISSVGFVRASDKYTISIETATGDVEIVFKSAIVKLVPTKRGAKKND